LPTSSPTSAQQLRKERTKELEQKQQTTALPVMYLVLTVFPALTLLVIGLSKFYFKDDEAEYLPVVLTSLAFMDVTSDFFTITSLDSAAYAFVFSFGVLSLAAVTTFNTIASFVIIRTERARKPEFAKWCARHPCVLAFVTVFSAFKPNLAKVLGTGLFKSKTDAFSAPIFVKMETKLRAAGVLQIVLEDMTQLGLMLYLQQTLIGWTTLNIITSVIGALSLSLNVCITTIKLRRSYTAKKSVHHVEMRS